MTVAEQCPETISMADRKKKRKEDIKKNAEESECDVEIGTQCPI
jgi:hypothetical protein